MVFKEEFMEKSQKRVALSLIAIAVLFSALLFTSYAIFTYTKQGTKENKVTTGTASMSFVEDTDGIEITNAYPITDDEGKRILKQDLTKEQTVTNGYLDFTVSANVSGEATIAYDVYLKNISVAPAVPNQYIKVYLTNGEEEEAYPSYATTVPTFSSLATYKDDATQKVLYHGEFKNGEVSQTFRLRLWIASNYGENQGDEGTSKSFKAKVGVEASQVINP